MSHQLPEAKSGAHVVLASLVVALLLALAFWLGLSVPIATKRQHLNTDLWLVILEVGLATLWTLGRQPADVCTTKWRFAATFMAVNPGLPLAALFVGFSPGLGWLRSDLAVFSLIGLMLLALVNALVGLVAGALWGAVYLYVPDKLHRAVRLRFVAGGLAVMMLALLLINLVVVHATALQVQQEARRHFAGNYAAGAPLQSLQSGLAPTGGTYFRPGGALPMEVRDDLLACKPERCIYAQYNSTVGQLERPWRKLFGNHAAALLLEYPAHPHSLAPRPPATRPRRVIIFPPSTLGAADWTAPADTYTFAVMPCDADASQRALAGPLCQDRRSEFPVARLADRNTNATLALVLQDAASADNPARSVDYVLQQLRQIPSATGAAPGNKCDTLPLG